MAIPGMKIFMGIRLPTIVHHAKQILQPRSLQNHQSSSSPMASTSDVPKGHLAVYVGEHQKNRFVVPISYLKHPLFQDLLRKAEEEYGFDHPMGGLTIPCSEDAFLNVTSHLNDYRRKFN
ncbi:hypothetical protein F0562_020491 [Nyssa sinensis]|uniref:Uncharacterized protein n=1 Tax=Nyssa sinensis TaxID=561372 RepID=A0A5J5BTB8_9ASTE|nr:hypothetical protein F0562_020491 [Nyssa sinensis]